jgi:hypothetical protein
MLVDGTQHTMMQWAMYLYLLVRMWNAVEHTHAAVLALLTPANRTMYRTDWTTVMVWMIAMYIGWHGETSWTTHITSLLYNTAAWLTHRLTFRRRKRKHQTDGAQ